MGNVFSSKQQEKNTEVKTSLSTAHSKTTKAQGSVIEEVKLETDLELLLRDFKAQSDKLSGSKSGE
jgi:hypothetical protein